MDGLDRDGKKIWLASMLDEDGKVYLVTGTPVGSRIINMVLQFLVSVIDHGLGIAEATHLPRIQQGWRSQILGIERGLFFDALDVLVGSLP